MISNTAGIPNAIRKDVMNDDEMLSIANELTV